MAQCTRLDMLRLESQFLLIAGKKEHALEVYNAILEEAPNAYTYLAKAKLLEYLDKQPEAVENFEKAIRLARNEKCRMEIIRLILNLARSKQSILKLLAQKTMETDEAEKNLATEETLIVSKENAPLCLKNKEQSDIATVVVSGDTLVSSQENEKEESHNSEKESSVQTYIEEGSNQTYLGKTCIEEQGSDVSQDLDTTRPGKHREIFRSEVGQRFGKYDILDKLGEGGMGVVYKARDVELDRLVALKLVRGSGIIKPQQAERFLQEVKATARLKHPNVISIYDFGEYPQHYFTMEYVEGKTLTEMIQESTFKSQKAAKILCSICDAIQVAHEAKIIHRDLKPSNIMIENDENIKVMDFGLAKFLEGESLSKTGDILGTPSYMSPEQAESSDVDESTDIYAIGAIGYAMITGRPVFQGENILKLMRQVMYEDPTRPKLLNSQIDTDLEVIILKCLEKSPLKRYLTVKELGEDIHRYLENRPILAKPPGVFARILKWMKRNRELTISAAVILFSLIAIFSYISLQWIKQVRYNQALNIVYDLDRWDKNKISYQREAKVAFEKAISLSKNFIIYRHWGVFCLYYAYAHCDKENDHEIYYRLAEEKLKKAIEQNPDDYISMYFLYRIYTRWGDVGKIAEYGEKMFEIIQKLKPENEFKYVRIAMQILAKEVKSEQEKNKNRKIAIENLLMALRYNPQLFCAHNGIGGIYMQLKNYRKAEEHLERSLIIAPNFRLALLNRARLYLILANPKKSPKAALYWIKACGEFKKLLYKNPAPEIYYDLAKLYSIRKDIRHTLHYLRLTLQYGYKNIEGIRKDKAFSFLNHTREFKEIISN